MTWINKPLWSEGLFIKPAHFQQQERYFEHQQAQRWRHQQAYCWGFTRLEWDQSLLAVGKIALVRVEGVWPDGTYFSLPDGATMPPPYEVAQGVRNQILYLCVPIKALQRQVGDQTGGRYRYQPAHIDVNDISSDDHSRCSVAVMQLHCQLLLESEQRNDCLCMGVVHILEKDKDQRVVLAPHYIPPALDCSYIPALKGYIDDIEGVIGSRVRAIAARMCASGAGGASEVEDMLKLQLLNRYWSLFRHMGDCSPLAPLDLYRQLIQLTGELAAFSLEHIAPEFARYQHDDLLHSFEPLVQQLKDYLSYELNPKVVSITVKDTKFGVYRARIEDKTLFDNSHFILAIKADMSTEELRRVLPKQVRIASIETMPNLIQQNLLGLPVQLLPMPPRQLPFHQGFVYFQVDKNGAYWEQMLHSRGFGIQVGGEYSGLQLELWAIRAD